MPSYLMGIDNGLTVSKAAIFDLQGHEIAVQGHKVSLSYPGRLGSNAIARLSG